MPRPTAMKYIIDSGAAKTSELMDLKRTDAPGYEKLREMAEKEMDALGMVPLSGK